MFICFSISYFRCRTQTKNTRNICRKFLATSFNYETQSRPFRVHPSIEYLSDNDTSNPDCNYRTLRRLAQFAALQNFANNSNEMSMGPCGTYCSARALNSNKQNKCGTDRILQHSPCLVAFLSNGYYTIGRNEGSHVEEYLPTWSTWGYVQLDSDAIVDSHSNDNSSRNYYNNIRILPSMELTDALSMNSKTIIVYNLYGEQTRFFPPSYVGTCVCISSTAQNVRMGLVVKLDRKQIFCLFLVCFKYYQPRCRYHLRPCNRKTGKNRPKGTMSSS